MMQLYFYPSGGSKYKASDLRQIETFKNIAVFFWLHVLISIGQTDRLLQRFIRALDVSTVKERSGYTLDKYSDSGSKTDRTQPYRVMFELFNEI